MSQDKHKMFRQLTDSNQYEVLRRAAKNPYIAPEQRIQAIELFVHFADWMIDVLENHPEECDK